MKIDKSENVELGEKADISESVCSMDKVKKKKNGDWESYQKFQGSKKIELLKMKKKKKMKCFPLS